MQALPDIQDSRRPLFFSLVLIVACLCVFGVTASFELLPSWDDYAYVIDNETIRGFSWNHVATAFSSFFVSNYAPLHILSYMADFALGGLDPFWYHLGNVLLHGLNGVLFYLLLRRLGIKEWQSAAAAWIFLFHPVQVEAVAWVSQRKTLLAMLFFLVGLHAYHSWRAAPDRIRFYLLSLASVAGAMLSKSVAVIFPLIILCYDYAAPTLPERTLRRRLVEVLPFAAVAIAGAAMALISQAEGIGGRRGYPGGTPMTTVFTMTPVLVGYLKNCLWPFGLSPYYEVPIRQVPDVASLFSLALLFLVALGGFRLARKSRPLFFWFCVSFIGLLPVIQVVPILTLKNDRYLYFPLLGCSVLLAAAGSALLDRLPSLRKGGVMVIMTILLMLPALSFSQALHWRNDITIWSHAVSVDPNNRVGWLQLAKSYTERGDNVHSVEAFRRYMQLRSRFGPVRGYEDQ